MNVEITKDERKNIIVSIEGLYKVTLSMVSIDMLKKLYLFLQSLPKGTFNKKDAMDLVQLYINSETLKS